MERKPERVTPVKFSVAMIAYEGNLADFISTKILMVQNANGKWGPVAGGAEIIDSKPEHPYAAIKREWDEETGGEPFEFADKPRFLDTIMSVGKDHTSVGFIYRARLTDEAIEVFKKGKVITGDEDIVMAKLLNIDEIINILKNWETMLVRPEINGQTFIQICNVVMHNHDELFMPGVKDNFTAEYFGMPFKTSSLSLY